MLLLTFSLEKNRIKEALTLQAIPNSFLPKNFDGYQKKFQRRKWEINSIKRGNVDGTGKKDIPIELNKKPNSNSLVASWGRHTHYMAGQVKSNHFSNYCSTCTSHKSFFKKMNRILIFWLFLSLNFQEIDVFIGDITS